MALARLSSNPLLSLPARAFIFTMRGTPLLIQLYFIYYGLGQLIPGWMMRGFPFLRDGIWYALFAFSINTAGYTGYILRGAILAVPHGEIEAARAFGMSPAQVFFRVTLPRAVRICLNASTSDRTLSSRFLNEFFGAGVQHVAFATEDIFAAAAACRAAGLELLPIPDNYYDDLEARLALEPEMVDRLREAGILYDEDEGGRYFQLYTRAFRERFFFELVERDGYQGFGAPNAPIRLAAQARLARGAAIPRA